MLWIIAYYFLPLPLLFSAQAVVNIENSATFGSYRDHLNNVHTPLYYSFSYSGIHSKNFESALDVSLGNDFSDPKWRVLPTQATFTVPFSQGFEFAPSKKSRIQVGRQWFTESFDVAILDGATVPVYWSRDGGIYAYGGNLRMTDIKDTTNTPLAGASVFEQIAGFHTRLGCSNRNDDFDDPAIYGSTLKEFESILGTPELLAKTEFSPNTNIFSQLHGEITLYPSSQLNMSVSHAFRNPKRHATSQNDFVYRQFASSAQKTETASMHIQWSEAVGMEALYRIMNYDILDKSEWAHQQEISLPWTVTRNDFVTPLIGHIYNYSGRLVDMGLAYERRLTDYTNFKTELSVAHLDKINQINGWATEWRNGLKTRLASRLTTALWFEMDRSPLFDFDARVIASVTHFY